MDIKTILADKALKPKEKTEALSQALLADSQNVAELIAYAHTAKEAAKATCIEALEYATRQNTDIATPDVFGLVTESLADKAPRIKWESAKVIGNIAPLFVGKIEEAAGRLLDNTEHSGTVVRWSAAFALGEILKLRTPLNTELIPAIEAIMEREEKNSIKKIYQAALKKIQK